ncbi:MAG: hypothetical protein OEW06_15805, partial [Gemmatimonadota bacterium]|nr:hypothetical protein [Gemmatimonadota bacterium]
DVVVSGDMTGSLEVWQSGRVRGTSFTFAGKEWDVGPNSVIHLEHIVSEFVAAVLAEAQDIAGQSRPAVSHNAID